MDYGIIIAKMKFSIEITETLQRVVEEPATRHGKLRRTLPRQKIMQPFGLHDGRHEKEILHQ